MVTDPSTWENATDKPILWNGAMIYGTDKKPITEQSVKELFKGMWAFLEKKEPMTLDQKIKSINTLLNRMVSNGATDPNCSANEELKGKFNPRIIETYQYADYDKQLIIDGIPIYRYERDSADRFIKKPVDEGNFASFVKLRLKEIPSYQNTNGSQEYLNDYIQWEVNRCNESRTENIFGGYLFTDAMVELSAECTDEQKEKIGKIMVDYRKGGIRTSRLKQMLWDGHTGVDNYFFTDIVRAADFQEEQDLMADYFQESEFESEAEALEYLNASKYLNKYPRLKNHIIQNI
jgi:hypothetical protein